MATLSPKSSFALSSIRCTFRFALCPRRFYKDAEQAYACIKRGSDCASYFSRDLLSQHCHSFNNKHPIPSLQRTELTARGLKKTIVIHKLGVLHDIWIITGEYLRLTLRFTRLADSKTSALQAPQRGNLVRDLLTVAQRRAGNVGLL